MQNPDPAAPGAAATPTGLERRLEEAARYALLRRLTPALRHHLIGAMQPIGMIAALLERRSQSDAPDMESMRQKSAEMGQLSREATASCLDLVAWVAPKPSDSVTLSAGVAECLSVLETELALRGFTTFNEARGVETQVARIGLRSVLCATLIVLTDAAQHPAELVIEADKDSGGAPALSVTLRRRDGESFHAPPAPYRALEWEDVQLLARAESVALKRTGDRVRMQFSVMASST